MKSEYQRDQDARDYWASDEAGFNVVKKARQYAKDLGEAFVVFVGSLAVDNSTLSDKKTLL